MISPEFLRRYPFFALLTDEQLREVAMITEKVALEEGAVVFEDGQPANDFYILISGAIELFYVVVNERNSSLRKEFTVGEINPGEPFGLSSVIEQPVLTATAKVTEAGDALRIDALKLCALCELHPRLGYGLMRQVAKAMMNRLELTRIHLAAARA